MGFSTEWSDEDSVMVLRLLTLLGSALLVASCSNGRVAMKLPGDPLSIPHVKSCIYSWDSYPDQVDMVSSAMAEIDGPIGDFFAYKQAQDNGSSNYFISILARTKDEGVFMSMDNRHLEPLVVSIPMNLVDEWIDRFQDLFVGYKDQLVLGQTYKVSHPLCAFAISRRNGAVSRLIGVGHFDSGAPIQRFVSGVHRLEDILAPGLVRTRHSEDRIWNTERNRVEALRERIEDDIFFEVASWL